MASSSDNASMALFCDFENVALGVRDANYEKFDIKPVLERLLLKGSIVVKKAYCDWDRYKGFKSTMHEANFELIEIPHVRQSGKNSADIRMVVDALDLCYTKSHVNTFVIISGDSDFSPLVSKLRENAKQVIGVGVKQSTSDLLVANCDEFIFYDDLVRESRRSQARRESRESQQAPKRSPEEEQRRREELEARKIQAIEMAVETYEALASDRGDGGKVWASVVKEALKRRRPDFSESFYGFRTFGNLLEEAQRRGMLEFGRDEKSGAYVYRSSAPASAVATVEQAPSPEAIASEPSLVTDEATTPQSLPEVPVPELTLQAEEQQGLPAETGVPASREPRRRTRGGRKPTGRKGEPSTLPDLNAPAPATLPGSALPTQDEAVMTPPAESVSAAQSAAEPVALKAAAEMHPLTASVPVAAETVPAPAPSLVQEQGPSGTEASTSGENTTPTDMAPADAAAKKARKPATRGRRPRKPPVAPENA